MAEIIVLGGGHNGLVASIYLARAGFKTTVVERRDIVGGACVTENPFKSAPKLGSSTGAYLLGLAPPELLKDLGLELPLMRRDPHYFLPTTKKDSGYLLFGSNEAELKKQFLAFFSERDWRANQEMNAELAMMRDDLAPAWLMPPMSLEATAARSLPAGLRTPFLQPV